MSDRTQRGEQPSRAEPSAAQVRWECRCQHPPFLLATYDATGLIQIKVRNRYWYVRGTVQTICTRCGGEHSLDLRQGQPEASA